MTVWGGICLISVGSGRILDRWAIGSVFQPWPKPLYGELEEWLSTITRVGFSGGESEGGGDQTMLGAMMEQMSEQMDGMARMYAQTSQGQADVESHLIALTSTIEKLTHKLTKAKLKRWNVASSQERMISRMGESGGDGIDAESRMRLRSIDVQMLRVLEEVSTGRQESLSEIRSDLANLTKAITSLSKPSAGDQS